MRHIFNSTIIRSYDVRGIYKKTLFEQDFLVLGHLLSLSLERNMIVNVCCDGRFSSLPLKQSLIKGLIDGGCEVNDIGLGPTPMLYYSCFTNDAEMGLMITGSHNPSDHNGLKIVKDNKPFYGDELKKLSLNGKNYTLGKKKAGKLKSLNIKNKYIKNITSSLKQKNKTKIVWDAGNGSSGEVMEAISKKVLGKNILLYEKIDGSFPNHHPDPSEPENLEDLISVVKNKKFDCGIAFDGDGDRIGVVDDLGRIISGDLLLLLFSQEMILRDPSKKRIIIIYV